MEKSRVEIPVSLTFKNIYQTYQSLKNQDSTTYKLACGLMVDLPVLGKTRIPISKSGNVPLIKIPKVKIGSLKLKKLNLTGADLELNLEMNNPNNFNLALNKLNYDFKISNQTWANGLTQEKIKINKKSKDTLTIPILLNFFQMGSTVYNMLTGNKSLNYNFKGNLALNTSVPLLKDIKLSIDRSEKIKMPPT